MEVLIARIKGINFRIELHFVTDRFINYLNLLLEFCLAAYFFGSQASLRWAYMAKISFFQGIIKSY